MTGFDFAMGGDVNNTRIVREPERDRHARFGRAVLIGAFFVALLTANVHQHDRARQLGADREALQSAQKKELALRRHLQLEIDTHSAPAVVAARARRIGLVNPTAASTVTVVRVNPSRAPSRALVASR